MVQIVLPLNVALLHVITTFSSISILTLSRMVMLQIVLPLNVVLLHVITIFSSISILTLYDKFSHSKDVVFTYGEMASMMKPH